MKTKHFAYRFGYTFVALAVCLTLSFALCMPTTASAWVAEDEDQTEASAEEIAAALASGEIDLDGVDDNGDALTTDNDGSFTNDGATSASGEEGIALNASGEDGVSLAAGSYVFTTIGGATRYDTSVDEALSAFSTASTVIIAGGTNYADSIAGSGLAGALDAPIILTNPDTLQDVTSNAIKKLGASKIIILGGEAVVSENVANQLGSIVGAANVTRLYGPTRYETQMEIYNYGVANNLWSGNTAVVASGNNFPDALAISPVAFSLKAPVFFMDGTTELPAAQLEALKTSGKSSYLLIGGTTVASTTTEDALKALGSTVRLAGDTRYETAKAINDYAVANYGFTWDYVAFCSGETAWDSLGGGVMQGKNKRLLVLLDNKGAKTMPNVLVSKTPAHATYLGGKNVYSNAFKAQVAYRLGYRVSTIKDFKIYIDAGHGQNSSNNGVWDSGAVGCGYYEANLTSELADKVASVLRNTYGLEVYVNKSGYFRYRQAQASMLDCGLFLSIHFNSGGGTGSESYIHSYNAPYGAKRLQSCVTTRLANAVGRGNRGEGTMQLAVCSGNVPATLVEICFIDNQADMNAYVSKKDAVAKALAEGIAAY